MSRRLVTTVGLGAAGLGGYYFYKAGGSPKVAEKKLERDAAHYSAKLKGEMPGREKELKKAGEEYGKEAGVKVDNVLKDAKRETDSFDRKVQAFSNDAGKKIEEYKKEAAADFNKNVNKFDKTVSQKAAESKSWFGSWFK